MPDDPRLDSPPPPPGSVVDQAPPTDQLARLAPPRPPGNVVAPPVSAPPPPPTSGLRVATAPGSCAVFCHAAASRTGVCPGSGPLRHAAIRAAH
jgi:hypothetical protein